MFTRNWFRKSDAPRWVEKVERAGFTPHDKATVFLSARYGRQLRVPINEAKGYSGFVDFSPEKVVGFFDRQSLSALARLIAKPVCPIGTTGGNTVFLFMDSDGKSYALDMERELFAPIRSNNDDLLRALCGGENCRVDAYILDDEGKPTGDVIRQTNERDYWGLDSFPYMRKYLPERSLSPCRRPPTWRPMVKSVEHLLTNGSQMTSIMVSCGGFAFDPSGKPFFVSHCENSIYVRDKAGFKVSPPPPNIPNDLRPGECVPFNPPANWSQA